MSFSPEQKANIAIKEGYLSIIINTFLFVIKLTAGILSNSVALMADAWHTLSDSLSSIVLIFSMKQAKKGPDDNHPYGHGRFELIAGLIIGIMLFIIAFDFFVASIKSFFSDQQAIFSTFAYVVTLLSIILKEILAQYSFLMAKKTNYKSLLADGWHHRSDAISSLIILIGLLLKSYIFFIDAILGLAVSAMIAHAAYQVVKSSLSPLLGEAPSNELLNHINHVVLEIAGPNAGAHHFHYHEYGDHIEITFHLRFPDSMTVLETHNIINCIEKRLYNEINIEATIHAEPLSGKMP